MRNMSYHIDLDLLYERKTFLLKHIFYIFSRGFVTFDKTEAADAAIAEVSLVFHK